MAASKYASDLTLSKELKAKLETLHVVFLLDITGSMGSQIAGVKKMVSKFCQVERPGIVIHVWTFTESSEKCYVSRSPHGLKSSELVAYVEKLELNCPPDDPSVRNAHGGDGPENVVAGVVALTQIFSTLTNLLCFIITDNGPHHKSYGQSSEARAEKAWLTEHGYLNHDIFALLNKSISEMNVTIVPVLYGSAHTLKWYHQAAILTEGVILCPESSDSQLLANGLDALLNSFQQLTQSRRVDSHLVQCTAELLAGFSCVKINTAEFTIIDADFENSGDCKITSVKSNNVEDLKACIFGLMETTCDRFTGKKAGKRCRSVDPTLIAASVRVLVMSMLHLMGSTVNEVARFNESTGQLITLLSESKSETAELELKLLNLWIKKLDETRESLNDSRSKEKVGPGTLEQPVQCVIALGSALEYLNGIEQVPVSEEDVCAWMDMILQLTMCRLINVSFPLDVNGVPDFMDAWSSSVSQIELASVLSARSAVTLRDPDTCIYVDPISRRENTAAVIIAHPNDAILTQTYRCLSALPSLQGLVQSYLVSGGLKVFPSIVAGLQSSTLLSLLRTIKLSEELTQAKWEMARCLVWSLYQTISIPAAQIVASLKHGDGLNPADSISKLIAAVLFHLKRSEPSSYKITLWQLFEELSGDSVSWINTNREKYNITYLQDKEIAECFLTQRDESTDTFDPCIDLHESEKICLKKLSISNSSFDKLTSLVADSRPFKRTTQLYRLLEGFLQSDLTITEMDEGFKQDTQFLSNDELLQIYTVSLMLKKRSKRYELDDAKKWNQLKTKFDLTNINDFVIKYMNDVFNTEMCEWNGARRALARTKSLENVLAINANSIEECVAALKDASVEVVHLKYVLGRMDVLDVLMKLKDSQLETLGVALCINTEWTSQPPNQLCRHFESIRERFKAFPHIQVALKPEIMRAALCNREVPNRHGHHKLNIFPGISNWSQAYEDERLKHKKGNFEERLKLMKEFTEYVFKTINEIMLQFGNNRERLGKKTVFFPHMLQQSKVVSGIIEKLKILDKIDKPLWNVKTDETIKILALRKSIKGYQIHMDRFFRHAEA